MTKLGPLEESLLNDEASVNKDSDAKNTLKTCYSNAGFFSILTFSWMSPLITLGSKKTLDHEDLPLLSTNDSAYGTFSTFKKKLELECGNVRNLTTINLTKVLFFSTWQGILLSGFFAFLFVCASYVGPYLIDNFVQYLNDENKSKNEGYVLAMMFVAANLVDSLFQKHFVFKIQQVGVRMQSMLVSMIYTKGLTISCQSKAEHSSGEIINLLTVDAERIGEFCWYMHDIWMAVLQVSLALFILHRSVGVASVATFAATVVVMLLNLPVASLQEKFQGKLMEFKDKRMKATSEILMNMRILKLQTWEMKFLSKIIQIRKLEEIWLKKFLIGSAMAKLIFFNAPTFIAVVTFGTCVLIGIPLESGKILSALATFRILQLPIYSLPDTISVIAETKVSVDRIAAFLRLDDLQADVVEKLPRSSSDIAIEIEYGNFSWDLSSVNTTLKNINLRVSHGMRVAVCGTVGSGKSSLLTCIIGEMPKLSGTLKVCGTKAYVAQSPWIQSGKIEENILFGIEMDREKYERVLEACSLNKDLEVLPFGDQTIIGEKGINLSGGQKQRVQIARALYQDADIYLLDDPFSAVDAHTGSHLFKECLLNLLKTKTVIYITHQVEFLPDADLILVMKDGRITQSGKYNDLLTSGTEFMELVGAHRAALSSVKSLERRNTFKESSITGEDTGLLSDFELEQEVENIDDRNGKLDDTVEQKGQLVQDEEREKGTIGLKVFWTYITIAYGGALVPFIFLSQILTVVLQIASNYWMALATPVSATAEPNIGSLTLMVVYVSLSIGSSFATLARTVLAIISGYKTATLLFNQMHSSFIRAPMSFFDSTPSGRILNRASTDQSAIDMSISSLAWAFTYRVVQLFGNVAVMSQAAWQVIIVLIPVVAASIWYQVQYAPHLPLVLRGLTCTFTAGAKTGIVGRTGSGKSTLVQTLFRLVEPVAGQILIDKINISLIGIHDLRSRLSIIPQDPTMFQGTVRSNLDPLEEYTDKQIWEALDRCQLGDEVRKKEGKLDSTVTENGENWSMGQRQLVCLGRVLLKKSKILVLDEATASVDTATDNIIQQTVNQHFTDCTVIIIAHRITSILDSDMVLFLSEGLIEEYDSPKKLLKDKSSSLAQLVAEYTRRSNTGFGS
ncbi:ABC transporter C family member 3-like isoform X2 [Trifolium pratense]|uniref:ABC transporter C family member 3-like isoform X2 n=1 Tax=Trifolium pratense TaxID=57577 RepID=UPI001E696025|nr:ABC transporter C family member 3-like isoform X2 [Trifolium pratense]